MASKASIPLGVRAHNPLNIRPRDPWEGLDDPPYIESPQSGRFCSFKSNAFGFRAGGMNLISYADKHGINTVTGVISRWAPPEDNNDTTTYIKTVCDKTGFGPDEVINIKSYQDAWKLIHAMTEVEQGAPFEKYFKKWELDEGLRRAGYADVPATPLAQNVSVIGSTVAGATAAVQAAQPVIDTFRTSVETNQGLINLVTNMATKHTGALIVIAAAVCIVIYEVIKRNRG